MTTVSVNTYTHSVTYVADNILKSLKDIIRLSGMNPARLIERWESIEKALKTWLASKHLQKVVLEVYHPSTDNLIMRWEIEMAYDQPGDGTFYTDTERLRYDIKKTGLVPSSAHYCIVLETKNGAPDVEGWGPTKYRSTAGMVRQSLGSTVEHNGLGGSAAYWRKI
ncbi:MAG: HORMA domain containing protein [Kofleriaceae bacterium]